MKNFGYEVYNKLELDLNNVNKDKLEKNLILKPLNFILDYTDTSTEKDPFCRYTSPKQFQTTTFSASLCVQEKLSKQPMQGFTNESWMKQLGATYQNVNVYDNTVPVLISNL